jgi:hypothetical protein
MKRDEATQDEEWLTLEVGPLQRGALREDVMRFCERHALACDITERRHRLLSTRMTFRVRGEPDAISSLVGYLQWTGRTFQAGAAPQ